MTQLFRLVPKILTFLPGCIRNQRGSAIKWPFKKPLACKHSVHVVEKDPEGISYTKNCQKKTCILFNTQNMLLSPQTNPKPCDESRSNARDVDGWPFVDWDTCASQANPDLRAKQVVPKFGWWKKLSILTSVLNSSKCMQLNLSPKYNAIGSVSINSFDHIIRWRYHRWCTFNSVAKVVKLPSVDSATLVN